MNLTLFAFFNFVNKCFNWTGKFGSELWIGTLITCRLWFIFVFILYWIYCICWCLICFHPHLIFVKRIQIGIWIGAEFLSVLLELYIFFQGLVWHITQVPIYEMWFMYYLGSTSTRYFLLYSSHICLSSKGEWRLHHNIRMLQSYIYTIFLYNHPGLHVDIHVDTSFLYISVCLRIIIGMLILW